MPINPRFQVDAIKLDSGMPMQSAAKCPILVTFYCKKYGGPDEYFQDKIRMKNKRKFDEIDREFNRADEKKPVVLPGSRVDKRNNSYALDIRDIEI